MREVCAVRSCGQVRDDASVAGVDAELRRGRLGEDPVAVEQCDCRVVAGGFNAEDAQTAGGQTAARLEERKCAVEASLHEGYACDWHGQPVVCKVAPPLISVDRFGG